MVTTNARKHQIPEGSETSVSRSTIFERFGNSIRDVVPVANVTERALLVSSLAAAGEAPTPQRPLVVLRADAPGLHRVEYTVDGSTFIPSSGVLPFGSKAAADSFGVSNGGLLSVGDMALVGSAEYRWGGSAWLPFGEEPGVFTYASGYQNHANWDALQLTRRGKRARLRGTATVSASTTFAANTSYTLGTVAAGWRPVKGTFGPATLSPLSSAFVTATPGGVIQFALGAGGTFGANAWIIGFDIEWDLP